MKVLLIKPPMYISKRMLDYVSYALPLGLLQIAGVLEKSGNVAEVLDCLIEDFDHFEQVDKEIMKIGLRWDDLQSRVKKSKPDLIGVTNLFSSQADALFDTCRKCKEILPDVPLIVGGVHPTSAPLECIRNLSIDFVGVGEGELAIMNIVQYLKGEVSKDKILSIYYRENNIPKINGFFVPIENLDVLPLAAYHLIDFSKYFASALYDSTVRGGSHQKWASIITSRGCPYSCNFCSVRVIEGRKFRARSATHVFNEIKLLHDKYGIASFSFDDSNFNFDLNRSMQLLDLIIKNNLNISFMFPNGLRADRFSETFVNKLRQAGCEEVTLAFEHGDVLFLNKVVKKNLDPQKALTVARYISRCKIPLTGFFIFGMPGETIKNHKENVAFIYKAAMAGVIPNISLAMPLPNTELEKTALEKGFLEKALSPREYLLASSKKSVFRNLALPTDQYPRVIQGVFRRALLIVILFNPVLFLKHPFVRSLINSFGSMETLRIKIRKALNLIGLELSKE